jgi:hypothetical protein
MCGLNYRSYKTMDLMGRSSWTMRPPSSRERIYFRGCTGVDAAASPPSLTLFARLRGVTRVTTARCNEDVDFDGGAHRGAFRLSLDWRGGYMEPIKERRTKVNTPSHLYFLTQTTNAWDHAKDTFPNVLPELK